MQRHPPAPPTVTLGNLDPLRLSFFEYALTTILSLDVSETAFAQVIDGLPTRMAFLPNRGMVSTPPEIACREAPTEQSLDIFREFRRRLQPALLAVDSKAGLSYTGTLA